MLCRWAVSSWIDLHSHRLVTRIRQAIDFSSITFSLHGLTGSGSSLAYHWPTYRRRYQLTRPHFNILVFNHSSKTSQRPWNTMFTAPNSAMSRSYYGELLVYARIKINSGTTSCPKCLDLDTRRFHSMFAFCASAWTDCGFLRPTIDKNDWCLVDTIALGKGFPS